ncbi:hypothetical protein BXA06_04045 [Campylobacter lari]|nr:hypothetical protein [Campylobacter lari]
MTREQFNEIKERLAKYREIRHLTYENQQEAFLGNAFEKISEYFKAKDDLQRVKALCGIAILYLNSFNAEFINITINQNSSKKSYVMRDIVWDIQELMSEINNELDFEYIASEDFKDYEFDLIFKIECVVKDLGFNFYKCMIETIKEIESKNIGNYCEYENKFYQMPGAYTLDEAYKLAFYRESNEPSLNGKTKPKFHKENNIMWTFKYKSVLGGDMELNFIKWYKADYESCKL